MLLLLMQANIACELTPMFSLLFFQGSRPGFGRGGGSAFGASGSSME